MGVPQQVARTGSSALSRQILQTVVCLGHFGSGGTGEYGCDSSDEDITIMLSLGTP